MLWFPKDLIVLYSKHSYEGFLCIQELSVDLNIVIAMDLKI